MNDDVLRTNLLDLLHAVGDDTQRILLGGGYGLYLKQLHLAEAGVRTLIDAELWPSPMLTEPERDQVHANLRAFASDAQARSCVALVRSDFASDTARGVLAMREHQLWRNNSQLPAFLETLLGLMS